MHSDPREYKVDWLAFSYTINLAYYLKDIYAMLVEYLRYYNDDAYIPQESNEIQYTILKDENENISNGTTNFEEVDRYFRAFIPRH